MPGSEPPDWGDFPNTILHFLGPSAPRIDLRVPVSPESVRALTDLGLGPTFGILTAQNRMGVSQPRADNTKLATKLHRDVETKRVPFALVDACSPDHSHCEQSIAVTMQVSEVIELARKYDQLAIFWFDGHAFWIVPARSCQARLRLPIKRGYSEAT